MGLMPAVQRREGTKPCGVLGAKLNGMKFVEEPKKDARVQTQPRRNRGRKNPVPGGVSPGSESSASSLAHVAAQAATCQSLSLPAHGTGQKRWREDGRGFAGRTAGGGARLSTDRPGARPGVLHDGLLTQYAVLSLHR